MQYYDMFTFSA